MKLFSLLQAQTNSRLERYCAGHADTLITLPSDLQNQVQTIRDANLDLLLIATNVTAVTNNIALLALHRLARIQVTFGSCPTTTGIRNIDYFISGSLSEPASDAQEHYREKLVTLDGVGYCFDYPHELDNPTIKPNRENWGATEKNSCIYFRSQLLQNNSRTKGNLGKNSCCCT